MSNVAKLEQSPPQVIGATSILQVIERASTDPAVDVEKMVRLLGLYERVKAADAEQAFNAAMKAAKAEMPQVYRDGKNETTRSRYAKLETLAKAVDPVITKHGFVPSFGTDVSPLEGHYRITCELSHDAGHSKSYQLDVPSDGVGMKGTANKTPTHALGSTISYGRRYLKLMIFDIATTDDDDGRAAGFGPVVSDAQADELRQLLTQSHADVEKFLKHFNSPSVSDFPAAKFDNACRSLRLKMQQAKKDQTNG